MLAFIPHVILASSLPLDSRCLCVPCVCGTGIPRGITVLAQPCPPVAVTCDTAVLTAPRTLGTHWAHTGHRPTRLLY
jgi:hypothetical protein